MSEALGTAPVELPALPTRLSNRKLANGQRRTQGARRDAVDAFTSMSHLGPERQALAMSCRTATRPPKSIRLHFLDFIVEKYRASLASCRANR
jgi:hypothetical protein